jgi:xeroderma pigmentosum group C-complementing protein
VLLECVLELSCCLACWAECEGCPEIPRSFLATCACRYTSSWLAAEKLRDEEWWQGTLRPLRQLEAAATLAAGAGDGGSPAGAAAGAGAAALGPVAAAAAKKRQKKGAAVEQAAAKLLAEREDAELAQRVQQVRVRRRPAC